MCVRERVVNEYMDVYTHLWMRILYTMYVYITHIFGSTEKCDPCERFFDVTLAILVKKSIVTDFVLVKSI